METTMADAARAPYLTFPKGKSSFQIRDGKKYISTGKTDRSEAMIVLLEYLDRKKADEARTAAPITRLATVGNILDAWAEERQRENPETWRRKWRTLHQRMKWKIGKYLLTGVNKKLLDWYESERYREGVSEPTVRQELTTLTAAWSVALRADPPITDLPIPKIDLPAGSDPREAFLTHEEADRLIAAAEKEYLKLFIRIGLATAGRHRAILDLTWSRVDLERGTIDLRMPGETDGPVRVDVRGRRIRAPRMKKRGFCKIEGDIIDELRAAQERAASDHVIELAGRRLQSVGDGFKAAVIRAGLDPDEVTPHILRHTAITWLMQSGEDIYRVASFAGHSSPKMIEKVYGHHHPDFQGSIARRLARRA
ncbi:site-specific integrase [Xinfangfangia sp. D13-10-4-6]|uniref:tyrosine-type recombinase/integrase n=1 Tax=Pseudogemmobacter hezensis TaxID=2737662 RepID=UPI001556A817|nr:site-specific integrase [Pseudogemmobacter hezensis]NPD13976.1 site-specific integrase [Pseudogemmobacter hezensis]